MPTYSYFDYLEKVYEDYYTYYYENVYWPNYYNGTNYTGTYPPSEYEYTADVPKMEYITPPLYAFIILMAIVSIVIATYCFYKVVTVECRTSEQGKWSEKKHNKLVLVLTLFCILVHLLQNLTSPLLYYKMFIAFKPIAYDILMLWDIWFCFTRVSLYGLFVYRFFLVFRAQQVLYASSNRYRVLLFCLFAFIMIVQVIFYIFYVVIFYTAEMGNVYTEDDLSRTWKNIYWVFIALDMCFIALLGFLLSRSILSVLMDLKHVTISTEIHIFPANAPAKQKVPSKDEIPTLTATIDIGTTNSASSVSTGSSGPPAKIERELAAYVEAEHTTTSAASKSVSPPSAIATSISSSATSKVRRPSNKQELGSELVMLATKLALLIIVSMVSSFIYQFIWMLSYELGNNHLLMFSYTWCLDGVINMTCIYLSTASAKPHYRKLCVNTCKCHQCGLRCIKRIAHV